MIRSLMGLCAATMFAVAAHGADGYSPGVLILHSNQQPTPAQVIIAPDAGAGRLRG